MGVAYLANWQGSPADRVYKCVPKKRDDRLVPLVGVADVARLQVAPQELPNSGESGYPKIRHGVARMGRSQTATGNTLKICYCWPLIKLYRLMAVTCALT